MNKFNKDILELWSTYPTYNSEVKKRTPFLHTTPDKNKDYLLTLEINPAFSKPRLLQFIKRENLKYTESDIDENYIFENFNIKNIHKIIDLEEKITQKISSMNKSRVIADDLGLSYFHGDIYAIRETSSTLLKEYIKDDREFFEEQYKILRNFIEEINPKVILVTNALASKIFKENENLSWSNSRGTYVHNELDVLVYFSGMLYGQHPIDNCSYERLRWQINKNGIKL